jgi:hypothetical protein
VGGGCIPRLSKQDMYLVCILARKKRTSKMITKLLFSNSYSVQMLDCLVDFYFLQFNKSSEHFVHLKKCK